MSARRLVTGYVVATLAAAGCSEARRTPRGAESVSSSAAPSRPVPPARPSSEPARRGRVIWRFEVGAPLLAAPALGADGSVVVGTADGYVHVLASDGRFRFSHVLDSAVLGAPAVADDGVVFVGTTLGQILALHADGTSPWSYRAPTGAVTGLVLSASGLATFGGADGFAYGVARSGIAPWRVALGGRPMTTPVRVDAELLIGVEGGTLLRVGERGVVARERLGGRFRHDPVLGRDRRIAVVLDDDLLVLDAQLREQWTRRGFVAVCAPAGTQSDARWVALDAQGELVWFDDTGTLLRKTALGFVASGAPVVDAGSNVHVGTAAGELVTLSSDGSELGRVRVGAGPLLTPLWDAQRSRLVAASGDGAVAAIVAAASGAAR